LIAKEVMPVTPGWYTVNMGETSITSGDFYVELYYVGNESENPFLALDDTAPSGRSYAYSGASWCSLPCAGLPGGNWGMRAIVHGSSDENQADRVNNLVGIEVANPTAGQYEVRVAGYNVPEGPQPYALVIDIPPAPEADFTAEPLSGWAPLTVVFTNTSSGTYTTSAWDFGDSLTSTLGSPTHTYAASGSYTVTLTIAGPGGSDVEEKKGYILAEERLPIYVPLVTSDG
jgi:hypothetical protein